MTPYDQEIKELDKMQAQENSRRGISCVQTFLTYARMGDMQSAKAVFCNEHDKISSYPRIHNFIVRKFKIECLTSCIERCAYNEGWESYKSGVTFFDNPYFDNSQKEKAKHNWAKGWGEAQIEASLLTNFFSSDS